MGKAIGTASAIGLVVVGLVIGGVIFMALRPYCTTFEDRGVKYCKQLDWDGGSRVWTERIND